MREIALALANAETSGDPVRAAEASGRLDAARARRRGQVDAYRDATGTAPTLSDAAAGADQDTGLPPVPDTARQEDDDLTASVRCPVCHAGPGALCKGKRRNTRAPFHEVRAKVARELDAPTRRVPAGGRRADPVAATPTVAAAPAYRTEAYTFDEAAAAGYQPELLGEQAETWQTPEDLRRAWTEIAKQYDAAPAGTPDRRYYAHVLVFVESQAALRANTGSP
jgi:hypothetical protein